MRLQGKVALVTGSGRGIGRAIALELAIEGADLVVNFFRNRQPAEETAQAIRGLGRRALVVRANIGELEEIKAMFAAAAAEFGRLDILVCNAASGYNRPAMEQTPKGWEWTLNINARSMLFCAQHAVRMMAGRGSTILAITSPGSTRVLPDYIVVGASKAAVEAMVRYLAVELAPQGIVVNAISPGVVETDALRHFDAGRSGNLIQMLASATPAGRLVTPEDVGRLAAFMCTPDAKMIRGLVLLIDGGATLPGSSLLNPQPGEAPSP